MINTAGNACTPNPFTHIHSGTHTDRQVCPVDGCNCIQNPQTVGVNKKIFLSYKNAALAPGILTNGSLEYCTKNLH